MNPTPNAEVVIVDSTEVDAEAVLQLYRAVNWSSADHPDRLIGALTNCAERETDAFITAWQGEKLIGVGSAISDGHLVVYYPHLVVHPDFHGKGIGRRIIQRMSEKYGEFHQQSLLSDKEAVGFYEKCGFERSNCPSMWIYKGNDH